jgi:Fe-S oxidoreductase
MFVKFVSFVSTLISMQIENPIATTENCRYCLMCRHVCPVGHVTHNETLTPHGWGLTIASVKRGLLDWDTQTVNILYSCADCGLCRAHCVTDQPLPVAIAAARAEVTAQNRAPAVVYQLGHALATWGNFYAEQSPQPVVGNGEVALFVGDDAWYGWPPVLDAVKRLLSAAGIEPVLVGIGRNNGYLASSLGFPETAATLARANFDEITASGARRLLVLTPGDYYTFQRLYDQRLGIGLPEGLELIELTGFLADEMEAGRFSFAHNGHTPAYAYVDPTHAARVDGRHVPPRKLLSAALGGPGRELFWRAGRGHPCGNVALQFTQPKLADQLTRARLRDAAAAGAEMVITEDPGCLAHLQARAADYGLQVQGLHELLAGRLA